MSDIVERLLDRTSRWVALSEPDPLRLEAATEIERLRIVATWHARETDRLRAEIGRLKAALREAAESVLAEFEEDLTRQQRDYIVDQLVRRAALEGKP